jgi:hypothetical protein
MMRAMTALSPVLLVEGDLLDDVLAFLVANLRTAFCDAALVSPYAVGQANVRLSRRRVTEMGRERAPAFLRAAVRLEPCPHRR